MSFLRSARELMSEAERVETKINANPSVVIMFATNQGAMKSVDTGNVATFGLDVVECGSVRQQGQKDSGSVAFKHRAAHEIAQRTRASRHPNAGRVRVDRNSGGQSVRVRRSSRSVGHSL